MATKAKKKEVVDTRSPQQKAADTRRRRREEYEAAARELERSRAADQRRQDLIDHYFDDEQFILMVQVTRDSDRYFGHDTSPPTTKPATLTVKECNRCSSLVNIDLLSYHAEYHTDMEATNTNIFDSINDLTRTVYS